MRLLLYLLIISSFFACSTSETNSAVVENLKNIENDSSARLEALSKKAVEDLKVIPLDSLKIPRTVEEDGKMKGTPSKSWTSGFYPGMLWQLYGFSKDEKLREAADWWSAAVEKEKNDGGTHDLVGAIRSWDHHEHLWKFPVIIDNMMNLEMLFEATELTGDSTFYYLADQHAMTTLKNHFRPDNSSYHVVDYDPINGRVTKKNTHQGLHHESDWSRGQAWGLYGYTVAYRYTGKKEYLEQAQKIADFIFNHPNLPKDLIPYWDYDAPNIPNEPRDVSAAAVTASGLYELRGHDPTNAEKYTGWADKILESLAKDEYHFDTPPFFLKHSVGSIPGEFEMDAPIIYADYYYVEALIRQDKQANILTDLIKKNE